MTDLPDPADYVPMQVLARKLGIDRDNMYGLRRRGRFPAHKIMGQWMVPAADAAAFEIEYQYLKRERHTPTDTQGAAS